MAKEKIWVWKHLLHPCLGSYLSSLDRKGSFLTCPQPPCGPGQCSCFTLENSRQQQAAGIKQLSLSCHGFWLSPRRQSQVLPCHMPNQSNHVTLFRSQQAKVSSHKWESWGLTGMQGLGPQQTQAWLWLQMNAALMTPSRCHETRWSLHCCEISLKGSSSETDLLAL